MQKKLSNRSNFGWIFVLFIITAIILWLFNFWLALKLEPRETLYSPTHENFLGIRERGTFGDSFGAINALFSAFAFIGLVYTIFIQQKEISNQETTLREQEINSIKSQFESTFFEIVKLLCNNYDKITFITNGQEHSGTTAINFLYREMKTRNSGTVLSESIDEIGNKYSNIFGELFKLVKLPLELFEIRHKEINVDFYSEVLRSIFSNTDFALIFLFMPTYVDYQNLMNLIEKYAILDLKNTLWSEELRINKSELKVYHSTKQRSWKIEY